MRCIEMLYLSLFLQTAIRLTLTWDVLKLDYYYGMDTTSVGININMRCIEIVFLYSGMAILNGLTLTWDVLK